MRSEYFLTVLCTTRQFMCDIVVSSWLLFPQPRKIYKGWSLNWLHDDDEECSATFECVCFMFACGKSWELGDRIVRQSYFSPIDLNRLLFTDGPCWTSDHKGWAVLLNFLPPLACCPELACPEGSLTLLLFLY